MQNPVKSAWLAISKEANTILEQEPLAEGLLKQNILECKDMAKGLARIISRRLDGGYFSSCQWEELFVQKYEELPGLLEDAVCDLQATVERDPACHSLLEPLLFFKGFQAIQAHRIAHSLWKKDRRFLAQLLQSTVSRSLAVDIHPAAKLGRGLLMDHATNIVIGETARVGNNVSILHGVSLGGTGKVSGDRHPKVGDGVMIGAHAQLLGNIRVGRGAKIGAGAVVLTDVPPHTTFAGIPAIKVGKPPVDMPSLDMQQDFTQG